MIMEMTAYHDVKARSFVLSLTLWCFISVIREVTKFFLGTLRKLKVVSTLYSCANVNRIIMYSLQFIAVRLLDIYVKLPEGKTLTTQVMNVGTITEIKRNVCLAEGLSTTSLVLKVWNLLLLCQLGSRSDLSLSTWQQHRRWVTASVYPSVRH